MVKNESRYKRLPFGFGRLIFILTVVSMGNGPFLPFFLLTLAPSPCSICHNISALLE